MDTNKKAIRDRGWGLLNKIFLQCPEIACSKPSPGIQQNGENLGDDDINTQELSPSSSQDTISKVEIEDINFNSGYAGEVIQTILKNLNEMNKLYGILKNLKKMVLISVTVLKRLKNEVPV